MKSILFLLIVLITSNISFTERIPDDEVVRYLKSHGYGGEAHQVVTDDGFILRVHRLPSKTLPPKKIPAFLMHSAFSNSFYYLNTPNISLGFYLADNGYDVWLGNVRGSKYATAHKWLSTESLEYWSFSFHEMGVIDAAVMIDYMLQQTGADKCFYVGHSQSSSQLLALLSVRPEYNQKIIQSHLFSPIGAWRDPRPPLKQLAPVYFIFLNMFFSRLPYVDFGPANRLGARSSDVFCTNGILLRMCQLFNFLLLGGDPAKPFSPNTDPEIYRTIFPTLSPRTGVKAVTHFVQSIMGGDFRLFDYGPNQNIKKYGTTSPPKYPLNKITSAVYLYAGKRDQIFRKKDSDVLSTQLPNVHYTVLENYNHIDFIYARNVREKIYKHVLREFENANNARKRRI